MRADDDTTESPGPVSIEFVEDVPSTLGTRAKAEDKLAVSNIQLEDLVAGAEVLRKKRKIVSEFAPDFLSHPRKTSLVYALCWSSMCFIKNVKVVACFPQLQHENLYFSRRSLVRRVIYKVILIKLYLISILWLKFLCSIFSLNSRIL